MPAVGENKANKVPYSKRLSPSEFPTPFSKLRRRQLRSVVGRPELRSWFLPCVDSEQGTVQVKHRFALLCFALLTD